MKTVEWTASPRVVLALTVLAATVAIAFGRFTYPVLLPAIKADLLDSYSIAGLLGTANLAAYLAAPVLVMLVAGRHQPHDLVRLGLTGSAIGLGLLAVAPTVPALATGMVVTGLAGAFVWIPAPAVASSAVAPERRGVAIGLLAAGIGTAIVCTGQLSAAIRRASGPETWRPIWMIQAAIAAVVVVAAWRGLRPDRTGPADTRRRLTTLQTVPGWRALAAVYAAFGFSYAIFFQYLGAMLEDEAGFSPSHLSWVYTCVGVVTVFGAVMAGHTSDRLGRPVVLVVGCTAMALGAAAVLLGSEPWTMLAAATFGLAAGGVPGVIAAYLADHLATRAFGVAFGAVTLAFGGGQVAGPQLGGSIAEATGSFTPTFLLSSGIAAAGAAGALHLHLGDR